MREELKSQPADLFFFLPAERAAKVETRKEVERLEKLLNWNSSFGVGAKLIELRNNAADSLGRSPKQRRRPRFAPACLASIR